MGTEIQAKTYLSGSYSMRDLNDGLDSGIWAMYHEHKALKNVQYYDSFLTRPAIDGYLGYDKEQMRQTILKHECIFRHQLEELHRLYKRQRDLMNEINSRELHQHPIPAEMSPSSLFLSHRPPGDVKKTCQVSDFPFMNPTFGRPPTSGSNSIQSPLSFMKGKNIFGPFPSQDRVTSKDCESPESKCNMFQRRLLNLDLPAAVQMNNEGNRLEESGCLVSRVESCPLGSGLRSGCNSDAFASHFNLRRTQDLVDLNEPVQVEEASISASVDNSGNVTCLDEEIQIWAVSGNSKSGHNIWTQSSLAGRDGDICLNNMHSEKEGNCTEYLTYKNEAGQSRCVADSFRGDVCPEGSSTLFKSVQVEPSKVDEPSALFFPSDKSNKEPRRKRTIFGVDFSEGSHNQYVEASHTPSPCRLIPQDDVAKSEPSSLSPWSKASNIFSQDEFSVRENPCISTSFPTNRSSSSLVQSLEFVSGKMLFSINSSSVSRAEGSCQHTISLDSQSDAKQFQVCCSSMGFDFPNIINRNSSVCEQLESHSSIKHLKVSDWMNVKSAMDVKSDVVSPYKFQDKVIFQKNPGFVDGQRKHKNPMGGLPWLKEELAKVEPIKAREDSHQMNLHSFPNYSQQFADKSQMGKGLSQSLVCNSTSPMSLSHAKLEKIEVGACPSSSKILGFPIFVPLASRDLTSLNPPSKSSCLASDGDGANDRKDLDHEPSSGGLLEVNDLVTEKGLGNYISGLRHHIDLNLCMNEDEAPPVPSLPIAIVKIATTEIDLEAPAVLDSEMGPAPEADFLANQLKNPSKLPLDESEEHNEELVTVAAEAIIAISLSDLKGDITSHPLCLVSCDSLHWFADVVSSYEGDLEGGLKAVSRGTDSAYDEEIIPDGMDYFEFMTLKLPETKVEEDSNECLALQNQKDEETGPTVLSKRPRRGQARRGRQRKDFQRDILPGLVSLSRHEVTEDLQVIEELFKASGFTWQPILSQRNTAKNGRGRRRSGVSAPSLTPTPVCPPPPVEQPIYRELVLEERTLSGWGKRTRRLPRHRCPTNNPTHALKV